jgi:arsenate reductase-like glutaredoxin family protein
LEAKEAEVVETVPASRKLGRDRALELLDMASKVIVAKGKKLREFDTTSDDRDEIADAMLGPTGNLRAPTAVVGKTVLVGFNEERYLEFLG